jgi:hypothetical protein
MWPQDQVQNIPGFIIIYPKLSTSCYRKIFKFLGFVTGIQCITSAFTIWPCSGMEIGINYQKFNHAKASVLLQYDC